MSEFYKITKPHWSELGDVPQVAVVTADYNQNKGLHYIQASSTRGKLESMPNFDAFQLSGKAKLTDWIPSIVMIIPSRFLMVSPKLSSIIAQHKIVEGHQVFDAYFVKRKKKHQYHCHYIYELNPDIIDIPSTQFIEIDSVLGTKKKSIEVNTFDEFYEHRAYYQARRELKSIISVDQLALHKEKIDVDFFRIVFSSASGYYVSEKLKNAIVEANCTGLTFKPI